MLSKIIDLTDALRDSPTKVPATAARLVAASLLTREQKGAGDRFGDTRRFWEGRASAGTAVFTALQRKGSEDAASVQGSEGATGEGDPTPAGSGCDDRAAISPDLVPASRALAVWARAGAARVEEERAAHRLFEPQASFFGRALRQLALAAEHLPRSAAVQRDVVRAMLDHGLMESLIDQALDFDELARTLSPLSDRGQRGALPGPSSAPGVDESSGRGAFAGHARQLARRAEEVPIHLFTLQDLLRAAPTSTTPRAPPPPPAGARPRAAASRPARRLAAGWRRARRPSGSRASSASRG